MIPVAAVLIAGCATTVHGSGHLATGHQRTGSTGPGGPAPGPTGPGGTRPAPAPGQPRCPTVSDPLSHLRYACITTGMRVVTDKVWPLNLQVSVEQGWALSEGSGFAPDTGGKSLEELARGARAAMLANAEYGPNPTVDETASAGRKIDGRDAWLVQTTYTIDPTYRAQQHLKVRTEKSWTLAVTLGHDVASLWYVTVPDDVSALWSRVPGLIDGITVQD